MKEGTILPLISRYQIQPSGTELKFVRLNLRVYHALGMDRQEETQHTSKAK